jgi:hypothetical protein
MDFRTVLKCTTCCVSLFVGLFSSILQITGKKKKKHGLLGTRKEIWDFCNKYIP